MTQLGGVAGSLVVTSSGNSEDDRGAAIAARVDALGIGDREWHAATGIDRKTLHRAIQNQPGTRSSTYRAIEAELDRLEAKASGRPTATEATANPNFIRFTVEGVYGAKALIVEGPVENVAELEAAVDRIMRRLAGENGSAE